jgi:hypothetical protein
MNRDESTSENGKGTEKNGQKVLIGTSIVGAQGLTVRHKAHLTDFPQALDRVRRLLSGQ